jgi:hypothetical protein
LLGDKPFFIAASPAVAHYCLGLSAFGNAPTFALVTDERQRRVRTLTK